MKTPILMSPRLDASAAMLACLLLREGVQLNVNNIRENSLQVVHPELSYESPLDELDDGYGVDVTPIARNDKASSETTTYDALVVITYEMIILRPLLHPHRTHPEDPLPPTIRPRLHQSVAIHLPIRPHGVFGHSPGPSWFEFSFLY
eukprot:scaffold13806_cov80-Skeletonema_dohrnii-CCMP3373.AAC.4